MLNKLKLSKFIVPVLAIILIIGAFVFLVIRLETVCESLGTIKTELTQVKQEFQNYQSLVQKVNDIDTKFSRELADEKAKNNELYNDVISGLGRLQLNIKQTTATSVDDAKSCELTGEARQNYYLLRDDIITKDKMILGLQHYINEICLTE